jgi:hypothetical protein
MINGGLRMDYYDDGSRDKKKRMEIPGAMPAIIMQAPGALKYGDSKTDIG